MASPKLGISRLAQAAELVRDSVRGPPCEFICGITL